MKTHATSPVYLADLVLNSVRPALTTLSCALCLSLIACDAEDPKGPGGAKAGEPAGAGEGGEAGAGSDAGVDGAVEAGSSSGLMAGVMMGGALPTLDMDPPDEGVEDMELDMAPEPDMMVIPECANGQDDDGDGLIDYPRDPGCVAADGSLEADPERFACEDELDNDGDGLIDLADSACSDPRDPSEEGSCLGHEGIDVSSVSRSVYDSEGSPALLDTCRSNNAPELVFLFTLRTPVESLIFNTLGSGFDTLMSVRRDCLGPDSEVACNDDAGDERTSAVVLNRPALGDYVIVVDGFGAEQGTVVLNVEGRVAEGEACPPEGGVILCPRGQACSEEGVCAPAGCSDELDNDGDERADFPGDPGCESPEDQSEENEPEAPECFDQMDNDGDGEVDFPNDPQCLSASDQREAADPQCSDRVDNDGDGLIDDLDPGCEDGEDNNEYNPPACRDGLDNDEDGFTDFPNDPGCLSTNDVSERTPSPAPECGDGLDNDGDGLTDYPEDAGSCASASDPTEDDPCERREPRDITGQRSARGNTDGDPNDFSASCGGDEGGDEVLVWRVEEDRPLASLSVTSRNSDISVVLSARARCGGGVEDELACSTSSGFTPINIGPREVGEDVYLFVDGRFRTGGIWRLQLDAKLAQGARCDGSLSWSCDDGASCLEQLDGTSRCIVPQCDDGLDNNEDGRVDYPNDPGCVDALDNLERSPEELPECANDIDDDGDGLFDFGEDPDCYAASDAREAPECRDGVDNDGDGRADFEGFGRADLSCTCANDPTEGVQEPVCSDGCDNDNDGLIDAEDPGCESPTDTDEFNEPACRDGLDNDEDGRVDFPNDPGCEALNDLDEVDPDPIPACSNGEDDDEDGLIDYPTDDGCSSAADQTEESACDLELPLLPESGSVTGDTSALSGTQVGACAFGSAPEAIWRVTLNHPATLTLDTLGAEGAGASFATVLYARRACRATLPCPPEEPDCTPERSELSCTRDPQGGGSATLSVAVEAGETYLFVDGFGNQSGTYELTVRGEYPLGELCDDSVSYVTCPEGSACVSPSEGEATRCVAAP